MWTDYVVNPFSGTDTGKHRRKQSALEDAQRRAIASPGETVTAYRAVHYTDSDEGYEGMLDLIPIASYWFDTKLQYEEA